MRILVLSDLHGRGSRFEQAVEAQPQAKAVLFLGDGVEQAKELAAFYPQKSFYFVCGNCDLASLEPSTRTVTLNGTKILMTHGHKYDVKYSLEPLLQAAEQQGCKIAVYGHTHLAHEEYRNGIYLLNPGCLCGSRAKPSYGIIDLTPQGILTGIAYL